MERAKRAFSDLVHLQVPKDLVKSRQQSYQKSQQTNIPGSIMESPASSRSRSFEYSLLVPKPEGENNVAVETVETAPAKDTHSPFIPINPLQMCASLVRSHTQSTHLRSVLKTKQTFASPRTSNPGVTTPNPRHTLSGILDHDLIRGEFCHYSFILLVGSHVLNSITDPYDKQHRLNTLSLSYPDSE